MNETECAGCPLKTAFRAAMEIYRRLRQTLPPEFHDHLEKAARELLLAARALVDAGLDREGGADSPAVAPERIQVD